MQAKNPSMDPRLLTGHAGPIRTVAITPDRRWVVTGSHDNTARVWALRDGVDPATPIILTGYQTYTSGGGTERATLAISADGRWLVAGGYDGTVRIWDLSAENPNTKTHILSAHDGPVQCLAISPDGHWLITGSFFDVKI
jgi:WD40 repeat protein